MRETYLEARYRTLNRTASPGWQGDEKQVTIWMDALGMASTDNVSPWDALLLGVRRRATRVRWVDQVIDAIMEKHRRQCEDPEYDGDPNIPPAEVRTWLSESRQEERLLARSAKMAIDAGVAVEMVRRQEVEGRIVTDALIAGLDVLNLTQDQRIAAITAMHAKLAGPQALPAGETISAEVEGDDDGNTP
jgi:hypothetical protein